MVITNNEIVRIRHLLVYAKEKKNHNNQIMNYGNSILSWIMQNKAIFSMICYGTLLIIIGLTNNRSFNYAIDKFMTRIFDTLGNLFKYCFPNEDEPVADAIGNKIKYFKD